MLALSVMSMIFAVFIGCSCFCMACGGDYFPMFLLGALYRIGLYTCVWILYKSLNESAIIADNNLLILASQEKVHDNMLACGDKLNVLSVDRAGDMMG